MSGEACWNNGLRCVIGVSLTGFVTLHGLLEGGIIGMNGSKHGDMGYENMNIFDFYFTGRRASCILYQLYLYPERKIQLLLVSRDQIPPYGTKRSSLSSPTNLPRPAAPSPSPPARTPRRQLSPPSRAQRRRPQFSSNPDASDCAAP